MEVAHFYDYGEFKDGYTSIEGAQHHMSDCPSLFPVEYKRVELLPCEAEWYSDFHRKLFRVDGLFGYYKGVMFLITDETTVIGPCRSKDGIYLLYPNSYKIILTQEEESHGTNSMAHRTH